MSTILATLLAEDNIHLPAGGGAEKAILCFSPDHADKTPSMSVNVAKGLYNCKGCGIKGNAYKYLTEIRRLTPQEAMQKLEALGATPAHTSALQKDTQAASDQASRLPNRVPQIQTKAKVTKDLLADRVATHEYTDTEGNLAFYVCRFEAWRDDKKHKDKTYRQFTPIRDTAKYGEGFWRCAPMNDQLPLSERIAKYPIYRAKPIADIVKSWRGLPEQSRRPIWIVEGEKCADIVDRLEKKSPTGADIDIPVCALFGGSKSPLDRHDLSPLYGQKVLLLADADKNGRAYMKKLGRHLHDNGCQVAFHLPPGTDGWDVGDAAADGWKGVNEYIVKTGGVQKWEAVNPPPADETDEALDIMSPEGIGNNDFFRIMGFEQGHVIAQSKVTHRIHKIPAQSVASEGQLLYLAPLYFWRALASTRHPTAKNRAVWADAIIRAAETRGERSTTSTHMWGRGAHKTPSGDIVYNVGNKILVENKVSGLLTDERPLTQDIDSAEIYLPGPPIDLKDDPEAFTYAADLYESVMRYRWESEEHGHVFLGWIVTSLIGGALPFRPMLWLTALPETGKTFLLEEVLQRVLGNLVSEWADVTEAGIAYQASASALPAYIDEFEPEQDKMSRMKAILGLIRVATSGGAARTRGNPQGGIIQSRPRFSLLMSSVDRPVLSGADESRIMPIRLAVVGVADWKSVRDAIRAAVTPERCLAIRTHIIRHTAVIARHQLELEEELLDEGTPTRQAQIRSALSAGVSFLSAETIVLDRRAQSLNDDHRLVHTLMQCTIRMAGANDMTVAEILTNGWFENDGTFITAKQAIDSYKSDLRQIAARHGFTWSSDGEALLFATGFENMKRLLWGTQYQHVELAEHLFRLPGADRARSAPTDKSPKGHLMRITFAGVSKSAIAVPRDTLRQMGLFNW